MKMKSLCQKTFPNKTHHVLVRLTGVLLLPVWLTFSLIEIVFIGLTAKPYKVKSVNGNYNAILKKMAIGETVTEEDLKVTDNMVKGINDRYGSSTFDFQTALRVLLTAKEKRDNSEDDAARWQVPPGYEPKIMRAFTGYRFFMTMPCNDNGVLWSENLQILHASAEYFTAILWPDSVFSADGKPASAHKAHAESRIKIWLEQRWLYGFVEWNSPTYYVEDVSPLTLIIDFAEDTGLRTQAKIILDLMLYDMATGQFDGIFGSTAGRCYANGRRLTAIEDYNGKGPLHIYNSVGCVINEMAGDDIYKGLTSSGDIDFSTGGYNGMLHNFKYRKKDGYDIPEVLSKISKDKNYRELKASYGLYLSELIEKELIGLNDNQIMMQWAMESFSNPETIKNTLTYCRGNQLFNNGNFKELRFFNLTFLRIAGLLPVITKAINPFSNGIALQRANMYTYKTPYYLQATAQSYCPQTHGNQQHVWTVNFGEFAVFAANPYDTYGKRNFWLSDGVIPTVAQDKNITMSIYDTRIKGVKIRKVYKYTHAHFPVSLFNKVEEGEISNGMIFGEKDGAFIALIAKNPIKFVDANGLEDTSFIRNNLVQDGEVTWWICESSDESKENFESFVTRIASNKHSFNNEILSYNSNGKSYAIVNKGSFSVDNEVMNLEYERYDSKYIQAARESETMTFYFENTSLHLDFYKAVRETR